MDKQLSLIILVVSFIIFALFICYSCKESFKRFFENFIGEIVTVDGLNFLKVGHGPAIDVSVMTLGTNGLSNSWQSNASHVPYLNHEGKQLYITADEFRAINGFIPPSFEFFPFGVDNDEYRPEDTTFLDETDPRRAGNKMDEGRQVCLQACKDTGCIAVQTEVPQVCYEARTKIKIPEGLKILGDELGAQEYMVSKGDCKGRATHGCTMFYRTIEEADDGYFNTSGGEDALFDPTIPFKCGIKYYEDNRIPSVSPTTGVPSESVVKWCSSEITRDGIASKFLTTSEDKPGCDCSKESCSDPLCCPCMAKYDDSGNITQFANEECDDPRCCVYRNLLTTDHAKHKTPYYNLPLNLTKSNELAENSIGALCHAKDQNNQCCGYCPTEDDPNRLVSCPQNRQYFDGTFKSKVGENSNIWWATDPNASRCSVPPPDYSWWTYINPVGWLQIIRDSSLDTREEEECIQSYQENYDSNKERAYDELLKCCGFLDQACESVTVQPMCSTGTSSLTERGCYGDPQILSVDKVVGVVAACDDTSVIPPKNRCVQDVDGKVCKAFPYGCGEESGSLWVPR